MRNPNDIRPGSEIITPQGVGTLVMIKPGNFRNQNYKIEFPNGTSKWYTLDTLQKAYKLAA
jgi:hypothetical protein